MRDVNTPRGGMARSDKRRTRERLRNHCPNCDEHVIVNGPLHHCRTTGKMFGISIQTLPSKGEYLWGFPVNG